MTLEVGPLCCHLCRKVLILLQGTYLLGESWKLAECSRAFYSLCGGRGGPEVPDEPRRGKYADMPKIVSVTEFPHPALSTQLTVPH